MEYDVQAGSYKKYFFDSLATMLASGIDIHTILVELERESKQKYLKRMIGEMIVEVENGTPVWKVIDKHQLVPAYYLSLIKIGEQSGSLPHSLQSVVSQIERDRDFKNKLRSASLYPSVVGVVLVVVTFILMTFVMPKITTVYQSLNIELPGITKAMISIGNFLSGNVSIVMPVFVVLLVMVCYLLFFSKRFKKMMNQVLFKIPGIGRMIQEIELSRMGYLLSSLLQSGISLPEALLLVKESTDISAYEKLYEYMSIFVEKGYSLDAILNSYKGIEKIIPVYPRQLIIDGERSRHLTENLIKIGDIYQKKNELTVKDLGTMFEPILLIVIWIGVSVFAISVILPIYSILGNLTDAASGTPVTAGKASTTVTVTATPTPTTELVTNMEDIMPSTDNAE